MVNALYNQEWQQCKAVAAYVFNCSCLFAIAKLKLFTLAVLIYTCNYCTAVDNSYYKAYLIKVVEVVVLDTVLRTHIDY